MWNEQESELMRIIGDADRHGMEERWEHAHERKPKTRESNHLIVLLLVHAGDRVNRCRE